MLFVQAPDLDWRIINDGVMGDFSKGREQTTAEGYGRFTAQLSLKNNGGFTCVMNGIPSVRGKDADKIIIRVKGNGLRYGLRLRPQGDYDHVSYRAYFLPTPHSWQRHEFARDEFTATFRGQILNKVPSLKDQVLDKVGFLIADEQEGWFELLTDTIVFVSENGSAVRLP